MIYFRLFYRRDSQRQNKGPLFLLLLRDSLNRK